MFQVEYWFMTFHVSSENGFETPLDEIAIQTNILSGYLAVGMYFTLGEVNEVSLE